MASKRTYIKVVTPKFRVSFAHLDAPHGMPGGKEEDKKYSVTMLFPKTDDISWFKTAVQQAMVGEFGADKTKWPKGLHNPLRDGDQKESPMPGYEGHYYIAAKSGERPGCVNSKCEDILDVKAEVYSGCYARATIAIGYFDRAGKKGVTVFLNNVQKLAEGERFGGKGDPKKDFAKIESSNDDEVVVEDTDDMLG